MQNYDLIIAGGGTAGCACAYIAAAGGLNTLLIEKNSCLGGAITSQLVIPAMKTFHGDLNQIFFNHFVKNMREKNAQITYCDGNQGWFNPFIAKDVLYSMLEDVGVDIRLNSEITHINTSHAQTFQKNYETKHINNIAQPLPESPRVLSIYFETKDSDNLQDADAGYFEVNGKFFVDATGDAKLFELARASFLEPDERKQALSLRFVMAGVDKKAFVEWILALDKDRNVTTACEIDGDVHFSTAYTWDTDRDWALAHIFDRAVKDNVLQNEDRAYFQVFSIAGMPDGVAFNCPRLFGENPKDAYNEGVDRISRLADFARKYLRGFDSAHIYKIADSVGVRASRQIKGRYILTADDIVSGREFEHPVAISDYPIDVHSLKKDDSTLNYVQKPYQVPLEALMSADFDNLFAVGRCISAEFLAQAAIRIQPTCCSMGEGLAKYLLSLL